MLSVRNLSFSYGSREVLHDISFDAEENQIVSILGPNGTGKTTMLKCFCNIHKPDSGSVEVDGVNVLRLKGKELSKRIGFVPQSVPVSRMTVYDSVLIGRRPYIELNAKARDLEKTSAVIDAMGLSHLSLRYLDELSGGEFQKVQIARAIVQEPSVLILDEPTNNLDISNQHTTLQIVEGIVRSRGMCTVMTMHDINLAIHYSDRFLFVKDGLVAAFGGLEVITEDLIQEVYGVESDVVMHRGVPFVVPKHSPKYADEPCRARPAPGCGGVPTACGLRAGDETVSGRPIHHERDQKMRLERARRRLPVEHGPPLDTVLGGADQKGGRRLRGHRGHRMRAG